MQETTDTLDTLSTASGQSDNFILFITLSVIGLAILVWFIIRVKQKKVAKKIQMPLTRTVIHDTKNVEAPKLKTPIAPPTQAKKPTTEIKKDVVKEPQKKFEPKVVVPLPPKVEPIQEPEPSQPKFIGYNPINLFEQTEPIKFPFVIMPKPNCVIKFPQRGRSGRKGYKEEDFKIHLTKFFKTSFQLFDDRYILIKGSSSPYEPDFTLIDEKAGINIFLDVEIDEPYEGINDIAKRKATHFRFADTNRNNAFKNRGWIVIRFAEIQVHQNPDSCCLFIANVIANIHSQFKIPDGLRSVKTITLVPQWTKEEAEQMSREKYRERYLGIDNFGFIADNSQITASETKLGEEIEKQVKDEAPIIIPPTFQPSANPNLDLIKTAIRSSHFVAFNYNGSKTIVKPLALNNGTLNAYCYIKNMPKEFTLASILNPIIKQRAFTLEASGPNIGLDRITSIVNTAIQYHKFIRMRYTRSAWTSMQVDEDTGEIIADVTEAEESTRTISNVQLAINALDEQHIEQYNLNENYVTAYCHRREAQRTFKFDRIGELSILDI